ncbi:hypothetical protein CLAIMM_06088 [Cladophialophora immunda]|nr:hypothetical protein CLAIMM_06088 [Cladophialophora immunda]
MASSASSSTQIEPPFEQRLALSHLLLELFRAIDHEAIFDAKSRDNEVMDLEEGEILSNTNIHLEEDEFQYPEELTMHIVLADALQYLQVRKLGFVASREVRSYSYEELVVSLKRHLKSSQPCRAKYQSANGTSTTKSDRTYNRVQQAVKTVIAQLEEGNWPIEPVARYACSDDSCARYGDANSPCRVQESTRSGLSSDSEGAFPCQKTHHTVSPASIKRSPGAISALFANSSTRTPSQVTTHYTIEYIKENRTTSSTPIYVRRSPGAISAVFANPHPKTWSPAESNCSITPSESASQVRFRKERVAKGSNPIVTTSQDERLNTVRYIRKPGSLSAIFNDPQPHSTPSFEPMKPELERSKIDIGEGRILATAATGKQEQEGVERALERIDALIDDWLKEE